MNSKIAILKDSVNNISDLFHVTHIDIYEKNSKWEIFKIIDRLEVNTSTTSALRLFLEDLMKQLGDCKIIIGLTIMGMPYHILDRNDFILCEAETFSLKLLDEVYEDYCMPKEEERKESALDVPSFPQPVDNDGNFYLDFIEVQKYRPEVTSKKALIPFLSHELFQTLTIECSHIMPWLENFLLERGLEYSVKRENGRYLVVITHKQCEE